MAENFNFTKRDIEAIEPGEKRAYYSDTKVQGLILVVQPSGAKSFQIYKKLNGKPLRHTLGRYPDMSIERARKRAHEKLAEIAEGVNPNAKRRAGEAATITLQQVFDAYLGARKKLKPRTIKDYKQLLDETFEKWKQRPFRDIDKDAVRQIHLKAGKKSHARANYAMRLLRALFNFAMVEYEDADGNSLFPANPVKKLSQQRAWFDVKRRKRVLKPDQIQPWYQAVMALEKENTLSQAEAVRDLLLLYLFTGMRLTEGFTLRVADVDLVHRTYRIADPKNGEDITLPLTTFTHELLSKRLALIGDSEFVFPGTRGSSSGHLTEPKNHYRKVREDCGIYFTPHDLRRTYITIAESLDISNYTLKRLLNHKINKGDVTAGYIITDVERLRAPAQRITDELLRLINGPVPAKLSRADAMKLYRTRFWEEMSPHDRSLFQLFEENICMPLDIFQESLEAALGRPIQASEFDRPENLRREFLNGKEPPGPEDILALIPKEMRLMLAQEPDKAHG